jgi:hypothetical protein
MREIPDVAEIPESPEAGQEDETLSADSPLGLALAGHQPGDTVSYETPQGPQRVQLLSVKLPPQQGVCRILLRGLPPPVAFPFDHVNSRADGGAHNRRYRCPCDDP